MHARRLLYDVQRCIILFIPVAYRISTIILYGDIGSVEGFGVAEVELAKAAPESTRVPIQEKKISSIVRYKVSILHNDTQCRYSTFAAVSKYNNNITYTIL